MTLFQHMGFRSASGQTRVHALIIALIICCVGSFDFARAQDSNTDQQSSNGQMTNLGQLPTAQTPITPNSQYTPASPLTTQGLFEPPLSSPEETPLPSGSGTLSLGRWLLTPSLGLYTLYDTNVHSSATTPLLGPGFHIHPSVSAEYNTGLYDTQLYGNIDSEIYPTLDDQNTFDRQAGIIQKYSPLRDLVFSVQADYTHNTNANFLVQSLPTPISTPGSPTPPGAAGVTASQQTVVDPNDAYTLTGTVYKEFNRAFVQLGGVLQSTQYETQATQNFNRETYDGNGGFWFSPLFYAYGDGIQSFSDPEVGSNSNYFRARGGIGSAPIGLFQGSVYYGQQGSEVSGAGRAGGDIYGGVISYFPTSEWNMSFSVDRLRNISGITSGSSQGLAGLQFAAVGISAGQSVEVTTLTYRTNYTFSPQTSGYLVLSDNFIQFVQGAPLLEQSWLASVGIQHQVSPHLSVSLDYQYSRFISPTPDTSFNRNLVTAGAVYRFF
jgi:opacity protein-like surface antigen